MRKRLDELLYGVPDPRELDAPRPSHDDIAEATTKFLSGGGSIDHREPEDVIQPLTDAMIRTQKRASKGWRGRSYKPTNGEKPQ